jgi:hypothetical protein
MAMIYNMAVMITLAKVRCGFLKSNPSSCIGIAVCSAAQRHLPAEWLASR